MILWRANAAVVYLVTKRCEWLWLVLSLRMVYRDYLKYRVVQLHTKYGYRAPTIVKLLREEGEYLSRRGISKFITRYKERGTIRRKPGSSRPSKVTEEVQSFVENQMQKDDETTAYQLFHLLKDAGMCISVANNIM